MGLKSKAMRRQYKKKQTRLNKKKENNKRVIATASRGSGVAYGLGDILWYIFWKIIEMHSNCNWLQIKLPLCRIWVHMHPN